MSLRGRLPENPLLAFPGYPHLEDLKVSYRPGILFTKFDGVEPIWFRMNNEEWEWTPYDPEFHYLGVTQRWYPVSTTVILEGDWKGHEPAPQNCKVIRILLQWQRCVKKEEQERRKKEGQVTSNLLTLANGIEIEIALKNGYKQFVPTNASAALDSVLKKIKTGWMPRRPVVIALFGSPGTGKNEMVRRFADQLWQYFVDQKGKRDFTKFPDFFKEHNFATLPNKEAISKFVGTSRGIEGGKGDLVIDLTKGAQVFFLDEFDKADPAIIKAFGGLFEDGRITDNSGAYAQCTFPAFFFISANYSGHQEILAKEIVQMPAFRNTSDQDQLQDEDLIDRLQEFKRVSFSGNLGFIGDRCYLTLLTYQPKSPDFCKGIAIKFLHDAAIQIPGAYLGWRSDLPEEYANKILQSGFSNRYWRNEILRDMLNSLGRFHPETLKNRIVVFSSKGQSELFEMTPEIKRIAESSLVVDLWTPQAKAEMESLVVVQENPQEILLSSTCFPRRPTYRDQVELTVPVKNYTLTPMLLGMLIVILLVISAQIIFRTDS